MAVTTRRLTKTAMAEGRVREKVRVQAWLASHPSVWHSAHVRQTRCATLRARELRRTMTDAEAKLWSRLRDGRLLGTKFRRQVPIGSYIADFCCRNLKLVIEVDGGQHARSAPHRMRRARACLRRMGTACCAFGMMKC